jgi:hypothetical protein
MMKQHIPPTSNKMNLIVVGLMAIFFIKLVMAIGKSMETANAEVIIVAIGFAIGWLAIMIFCLAGQRIGYWLGAILGLLHFVTIVLLPLTRICDHYCFVEIVANHGILITGLCLAVLLFHTKKNSLFNYFPAKKIDIVGFFLLCAFVLARTFMITFREPIGIAQALATMAGKGGLAELASSSLIYVVIPSMIALCVIIPGIVMKRCWAFASAAIFGGIHAILTSSIVILKVNSGYGPFVVIPASLGMLICGIWMLNIHAYQSKNQRVQPIDGHDLISL